MVHYDALSQSGENESNDPDVLTAVLFSDDWKKSLARLSISTGSRRPNKTGGNIGKLVSKEIVTIRRDEPSPEPYDVAVQKPDDLALHSDPHG